MITDLIILFGGISLIIVVPIIACCLKWRIYAWSQCPTCKMYHKGNVMLSFLPPDSDGCVRTETCSGCDIQRDGNEARNREIAAWIKEAK